MENTASPDAFLQRIAALLSGRDTHCCTIAQLTESVCCGLEVFTVPRNIALEMQWEQQVYLAVIMLQDQERILYDAGSDQVIINP